MFSTIKDKLEELPTESVEDRELVTSSPKWKEIVSNHNLYSSSLQQTRNMMDGAMVLGYVTPVRDINSHHALQQSYSSCFCCLSLHMLLVCILESYPTNSLFILYLQWNSHGYDIAKIFAGKFTHISPVWLQLTRR